MNRTLTLDFSESHFDTLEDMVLYWERHIDSVREDERLLNLLIDDLKSLNFEERYVTVHC